MAHSTFCLAFQTWKLYEILNYLGGHLCKSPPAREDFLLVSTETRDKYELDVAVKMSMHLRLEDEEEERRPFYLKLFPQFISDIVDANNGTHLCSSSIDRQNQIYFQRNLYVAQRI